MATSHVVIRCTDYRFVRPTTEWLKTLGLEGRYEDVAVAGSVKNIVDPYEANDSEFVLRQIEISRKLHPVTDVILIGHLGCGAYGQGTFADEAEERERQLRDLRHAKRHIEKRFEGVNLMAVLARLDAQGRVDFEPV